MIDTFMLPWEGSEHAFWKPIVESTPANDSGRVKGWTCSACAAQTLSGVQQHALSEFDNLDLDAELTPDQYFLCSCYVHGYVLKARKWGK